MAYYIDHTESYMPERQISFMADSSSDIPNLPTSSNPGLPQEGDSTAHLPVKPGSTCLCLNPVNLYILNSKDVWVKAKAGGS